MALNSTIARVTDRIIARSEGTRRIYLERMAAAAAEGPRRAHLTCGNQAHAYAPMGDDKDALVAEKSPNIGIITAYNDMLSAHQPFETYPIKFVQPRVQPAGQPKLRAVFRPCVTA